jgi:hypothetical protein
MKQEQPIPQGDFDVLGVTPKFWFWINKLAELIRISWYK